MCVYSSVKAGRASVIREKADPEGALVVRFE